MDYNPVVTAASAHKRIDGVTTRLNGVNVAINKLFDGLNAAFGRIRNLEDALQCLDPNFGRSKRRARPDDCDAAFATAVQNFIDHDRRTGRNREDAE